MGKVVTRECRKAKSAELEFAFVSALSDNSSFGLNILYTIYIYIYTIYVLYIYTSERRVINKVIVPLRLMIDSNPILAQMLKILLNNFSRILWINTAYKFYSLFVKQKKMYTNIETAMLSETWLRKK